MNHVSHIDQTQMEVFAQDYCQNLETYVSKKLSLINQLATLDTQGVNFETLCTAIVAQADNKWFDPFIPSIIITNGDMCHGIKEIYSELKTRNILDFTNAAIYTYVLIYQMDLNAMEESIFERCVDSRMLEDPFPYCQRSIVNNLNATLWSASTSQRACEEGAVAMLKKCGKPLPQGVVDSTDTATTIVVDTDLCYPCAYAISYIFAKYEKYSAMTVETVFDTMSKRASEMLHEIKMEVNQDTKDKQTARLKASKTLPIQMPGI